MSERTTYITTPIYYVNDVPHPGHAYTTIAADVVARARRLRGQDVFFLTGTDEHGQNIDQIARAKGVSPKDYCDQIAARFKALWERLGIRYDGFIRTTDDIHTRGVVAIWERLRAAKTPSGEPAVYRGTYAGWYCPRCEGFKTEEELKQPGNLCPDHERACEWTQEENFFFRLSAWSDWLKEAITSGELRIDPESRRNEVLAVIRQGLQDFSISRAHVKWGIPVPEDPAHVFYVWIDALSNYVTALGFADDAPNYHRYWEGASERMHLVGKEIIRFHCLYWPAVLKASGLPVPTRVFAHGWLTKNGKKLSKTTGNTIDPDQLIDAYGADPFRYFFLREGSFGQDWDFTDSAYVRRYNSDLANDLGNLVSRALTMVTRYCGGKVPARPAAGVPPAGAEADLQDATRLQSLCDTVFARYEALDFAGALGEIWSVVGRMNVRIAEAKPWEMEKDRARRGELDAFLYRLLEAVRLVATLAQPVIPVAASRVFAMLGLADAEATQVSLVWGVLAPGSALGTVQPLFPRLETSGSETKQQERKPKEKKPVSESKPEAAVPAPEDQPKATDTGGERSGIHSREASEGGPSRGERDVALPPDKSKIDISEFVRVELRAARILSAEAIKGSKKLIKLQVDLGDEQRQVVAGIADSYAPEALVGKTIALVANLKPAKLMGTESNGMVLAASREGKAVLCVFDGDVPPGTKIK